MRTVRGPWWAQLSNSPWRRSGPARARVPRAIHGGCVRFGSRLTGMPFPLHSAGRLCPPPREAGLPCQRASHLARPSGRHGMRSGPDRCDLGADLGSFGPTAPRATVLMDHHVDVDLTKFRANVPNGIAAFDRRTEPVVHHDLDVLGREARQAKRLSLSSVNRTVRGVSAMRPLSSAVCLDLIVCLSLQVRSRQDTEHSASKSHGSINEASCHDRVGPWRHRMELPGRWADLGASSPGALCCAQSTTCWSKSDMAR